jgi:NADH-quinone oxidoreductase subunit L
MLTNETLLWLIPVPPLLAFVITSLFTRGKNTLSHTLAITAAVISLGMSMLIVFRAIGMPEFAQHPFTSQINWLTIGDTPFNLGVQVDPISALALFFVAWTILSIFIYSTGYHNYGSQKGKADKMGLPPKGISVTENGKTVRKSSVEPMYSRFFAIAALFAFAMYFLVVADNLLSLYIGWEIMGLCSYLLIGFWFAKPSARDAAVKAFITTRIGDVFMLLGLAFLYTQTNSLQYAVVFSSETINQLLTIQTGLFGLNAAELAGLLFFIGVVGKSAQWPLHVWLPDAMEGPTPVSAMIHAATMVSAGVYLAIRISPLLSAGWHHGQALTTSMGIVALIGAFTALFAATIALAQRDIKRTLAYSTISQLGYMITAVGVGAPVAAAFHLLTHAFFKALLFMGSGSVIHGMEHGVYHTGKHIDAQDMFNMGGLAKKMPVTFITFLIGGLALAGFPILTAGFWSKDAVLSAAFSAPSQLFFWLLVIAAFLTAFYTMRQITLTFLGKPRTKEAQHAHESAPSMTGPLIILAIFAIGLGWIGIPKAFPLIGGILPDWLPEFLGSHTEEEVHLLPVILSITASLSGLFLGWLVYRNQSGTEKDPIAKPAGLYAFVQNGYKFDELYNVIFIKPAKWISEVFTSRWLDKGIIDGFLHAIAAGALLLGKGFRSGIDQPVINGGADLSAKGIYKSGKAIQPATGSVQQYILFSTIFLGVVSLAAVILFL